MTGGTEFWSQIIFLKQIACWNTVRPEDALQHCLCVLPHFEYEFAAPVWREAKKNHVQIFKFRPTLLCSIEIKGEAKKNHHIQIFKFCPTLSIYQNKREAKKNHTQIFKFRPTLLFTGQLFVTKYRAFIF